MKSDVIMRRKLFELFGEYGLGEEKPQRRPILGSDLIVSGFLHSEILGCKVRYSDEYPPEVICKNLDDAGVRSLQSPCFDLSLPWRKLQSQVDKLMSEFGYVLPCVNLMGIQNIALDIRGQQLFLDYFENPEIARKLLDVCQEVTLDIGQRLKSLSGNLSAGVSSITTKTVPDVYLTSNCTIEMVSCQIYEDFFLPCDKQLAELFQPFGIHHCGQTMEHVADGYVEVGNLLFCEVGAFSDIAAIRQRMPDIHLNARYSPVRLASADKDEMKRELEALTKAGQPSRLSSISCVSIDSTVSDDHVRNFLAACSGL